MSIEQSTIALAGMFQAADLVKKIAKHGLFDQAPYEASIQSLLKLDADSTLEVYGGLEGVKTGLQILSQQLIGKKREMDVIHYVFSMIFLEKKLVKQPQMMSTIRSGIEQIITQTQDEHSITHPEVIEHLASLYMQTLSTFEYRIKVTGEPRFLENTNNANKVRALLLAGIRSAVLWRQKGGRRWQFVWSRKKILQIAQQYLKSFEDIS
jgi:high frequency lysogenization protein